MDFVTLKNKLIDSGIYPYSLNVNVSFRTYERCSFYVGSNYDIPFTGAFVTESVVSGYSGGNCWNDDEPEYFETNEPAPEFDMHLILTTLFTKLPPNHIEIENRLEKLVHTKTFSESEYYGNSTDTEQRAITFVDIYNVLKEFNLVV